MYTIVTTPHPILISRAKRVVKFDAKLQDQILQMEETLKATYDPVGVGLAAPQVGLPLQIFQIRPIENGPIQTIINPKIIETSQKMELVHQKNSETINSQAKGKKPQKGKLLEGCLSIPTIWGYVKRNKEVRLLWQDVKGAFYKKKFTGFNAIIIQHEYDHLQGVLFTKHVLEQGNKLYKSSKDENNEDVFDEVNLP